MTEAVNQSDGERQEGRPPDRTVDHLGHLARGSALSLCGSATAAVAGLGLAVLVTRGLPARDAGLFFATVSTFALLVSACLLGVDTGLARFLLRWEAAGRHDDLHRILRMAIGPALAAALLTGTLLIVAAGPLADVLGFGDAGQLLLRIIAVALPCAVAAELFLAATRAFGHFRSTVAVDRVFRSLLQVVLVLAVLAGGGGLALVVSGWAGVYALSAVLALTALIRQLRLRRRARPDVADAGRDPGDGAPGLARSFWSFTGPRGVAGVAQVAIQKVDIVIVAILLSPSEAALYAAATRFVVIGQMANQAIHQVLQPRLTAILVHDDRSTLRGVFTTATSWSVLLVWPLYLTVGASPDLYLSLFGDRYAEAGTAAVATVLVMAGAMLLAVASGPVDTLLLMAGRSALSLGNSLLALLVDLALCLLLVPTIGILGAAIAWAAAVATRSGLAFWQVHGGLGVSPRLSVQARCALRPVVCFAVPLAAYSWLTPGGAVGWSIVLALATGAYAVTLHRARRVLQLDLLVAALTRPRPATSEVCTPAERSQPWTRESSPVP